MGSERFKSSTGPMLRSGRARHLLLRSGESQMSTASLRGSSGSIRRTQDAERCAILTWSRRPVDFAAVPDLQDEDRQGVIFHLIDNSIVPDTQPQKPFLSAECLHSPRAWVVGQGVDPWLEATLHLWGESPEVALCSWSENDTIGRGLQLKPQVRLDLLPGNRPLLPGLRQRRAGIVQVDAVLQGLDQSQVFHGDERCHILSPAVKDEALPPVSDPVQG